MRDGCSFCWYLWNCWPLLFKHFYMNSSLVFSVVRVTRSLVLCVCFVDRCLSFVLFRFVVYSSIYGFWFLPLWYLIISHISTYICKTQIHVRTQIRALSSHMCLPTNPCSIKLLYPQIRVLLPRKYVSFGIASHSNLCPPKSIFSQFGVLHFGRKMTSW